MRGILPKAMSVQGCCRTTPWEVLSIAVFIGQRFPQQKRRRFPLQPGLRELVPIDRGELIAVEIVAGLDS
jgi:hypothetical protein